MKKLLVLFLLSSLFNLNSIAQNSDKPRVILITTDGVRWQDLFYGIDTSIAKNKYFTENKSEELLKKYYDVDYKISRKKIMPFFYSELVKNGELHGNRKLGSKLNVANPYWFSYPGYSEILTGQVDTLINSNDYPPNPHINFFEHLNTLPDYKGKVAAFGAWNAFDRILNEERSGLPITDGFDKYSDISDTENAKLLTNMSENSFRIWGDAEIQDVFIHYQAMDYLKNKKPMAIYISYGETDEFAHEGNYFHYIDALNHFDTYVKEIWDFVQATPGYKNNTIILITTDHGRGDADKNQWTSHGQSVIDSHETWYAIMGRSISPLGEVNFEEQGYSKELIHRLAKLIDVEF